jgi:D-amino-acid dehydrogenase
VHALIIGSGVIGVSTAYFLRRRGVEVTVVDRSPGPGRETSFANAGLLTPGLADPWNAPGIARRLIKWLGREEAPILLRAKALPSIFGWGLAFLRNSAPERFYASLHKNIRLANYSLSVLRSLREHAKLEYGRAVAGTLKVFRDPRGFESAVQFAHSVEHLGVPFRVLSRRELPEVEPALRPVCAALAGGIHYPEDEAGDAYQYCEELAQIAQTEGVIFRFGVKVLAFRRARRRVEAALVDSGSPIEADVFVVAAGSYSPQLTKSLGVRIPVYPAKGYSISVPRGSWADGPTLPVVDDQLHAAVVPLGNRIRVAGTAEFAGYDTSIRVARIENLLRLLGAIYPSHANQIDASQVQAWTGLRPMSSGGVPILGRTKIENLVLNVGHGHLGWSMAAGSGKLIADLIAGAQPEMSLTEYGIDRTEGLRRAPRVVRAQ